MLEPLDYNMLLIGDTASGKSNLFKKIFKENSYKKIISTIGIDKKTLTIVAEVDDEGKQVTKKFNISLIDVGSFERFRVIPRTLYKESDIILLIYDVTNRESYCNVSRWMQSILESIENYETSKYLIVLLGNNIHLIGVDGKTREVEESEAKEKCQKYNIYWGGECSDTIFSQYELVSLIKEYAIKIYEKVGLKYENAQMVKLEENQKNNRYISWKSEKNEKSENKIKSNIDLEYYFDFSSLDTKIITKKLYKYLNY